MRSKLYSNNNAGNLISGYIKSARKSAGLTQKELALKSGVGLRFIRDVEQGKTSFRADTLNKVLRLFGKTLGPVDLEAEVGDEN